MNTSNVIGTPPKLYNLRGLVLAAILGSMISAAVLIYLNYGALNRKRSGLQIFAVIVALWTLLMSASIFIPDFPGDIIISIGIQAYLTLVIGNKLFEKTYVKFEENSGTYYSLWRCAGIAILVPSLLIAVIVLFVIQFNLQIS
jgi:hypothetical protein